MCAIALPPPTLCAPPFEPSLRGFSQPGITCPSHSDLVAHKEQIDLGPRCNLLIPSRVPLPQHYHTHTVERDVGVWAGTKPRPRQKYIYIIIYTCIRREEKLGA